MPETYKFTRKKTEQVERDARCAPVKSLASRRREFWQIYNRWPVWLFMVLSCVGGSTLVVWLRSLIGPSTDSIIVLVWCTLFTIAVGFVFFPIVWFVYRFPTARQVEEDCAKRRKYGLRNDIADIDVNFANSSHEQSSHQ